MADPVDEDDDEEVLSDQEVYDLVHEAWQLFQNKTVETPLGQDVLTVLIKQLELMQRAMLAVMDGVTFPPAAEPPPAPEEPSPSE